MDDSARIELLHHLQIRRGAIANAWYAAVAHTSYVPFSSVQLRQRFAELTAQAISLLISEHLDPREAQPIGDALARLHYTQPQALGRTLGVLASELVHGLPADRVDGMQRNLAALLEGVGTGFVQQTTGILLAEQEAIRGALVSELRQVEGQLRAARDSLEVQVERRSEELQAAEERWRTLVTEAPDAIFTVDRLGRIQFVNRLPPESGLTRHDVLGTSICDQVIPEHRELVEAALRHVFTMASSTHYEAAVRRRSGAVIWYSSHLGPLRRGDRVVAAMLIARDVTAHRNLEEMKDNLLGDVSHELRSPLARAQMSLELLLEKVEKGSIEPKSALKYANMAFDNVRLLFRMVDAILDLSRLEAEARTARREPLVLADLVAEVIEAMEPLASAKGLTIVTRLDGNLPLVEGDREQLLSVVRNLIDNAVKFSSAGQIVLSAGVREAEVEVSISDQGCGILPSNLDRVFDRFFRESLEFPGVGVGLPRCKAIVEAHGGRIWAESLGKDRGATFRFILPSMADLGNAPAEE